MLHSGKHEPDYTKVPFHELATTSIYVLKEQIDFAKSKSKPLVVFSTYHSAWKLIQIPNIGIVIADESQYCVSKEYFNTIVDINAKCKQFYTATEKHVTTTSMGRGLNNETVFGPAIYQISPQELINRGIIVKPRVHIMSASKPNKASDSIVHEVIEAAKEQHKLTIDQGMSYSKILFAMEGTGDIKTVVKHISKVKKALPDHKIFTIMSNEKYGCMIDGKKTIVETRLGQSFENKISRNKWFKELEQSDNALILHYDIIAEGIDIDGITGVVLKRNMSLSKLLQTIGRALRIYKSNPELKPQAWLTVEVIDGDEENRRWVESVLRDLRDGHYLIEDIKFTNNDSGGTEDDEGLEDMFDPSSSKGKVQSMIRDILHEIEDGLEWKKLSEMTVDELFDFASTKIQVDKTT
jgi:hypothetical protein